MYLMRMLHSFLLVCILILSLGCDERKSSPVGGEVIDREDLGQFGEVHIQPASRDSVVQTTTSTFASPLLLVGEWSGYQTKSLLKFEVLPESVQVDTASVTLFTSGVIDAETDFQSMVPDSLRIIVSLLETDWSADHVTFDTKLEYSAIETLAVGRSTDDSLTFFLPTDTVQAWVDETVEKYGLLLSYEEEPSGEGFIKSFYAAHTENSLSLWPRLNITWSVSDTSDTTVIVIPTADVFVVNRRIQWPFDTTTDRLMVGNGFVYRSLLLFNFEDSIPDDATIVNGDLTLYIDGFFSFFNSLEMGIYAVTTPTWDNPEYDSTKVILSTVYLEEEYVVFNIHSFIQDWVNGERPNYGLIVKSIREDRDISSFVFHSSQSEPDFGPKLDVVYVTPPDFGHKTVAEATKSEQ